MKKLHESAEFLSEACIEALGKIGTDAAAEAVTEGWLEAAWVYRLNATVALEKIHTDTTVRRCLKLLPQETDLAVRTHLADALLGQFANEGIEPVREMVQRRAYDSKATDLMRKLVTVSTVMGVTFPEYPIWKRQSEERWAKQERQVKKMWGSAQDSGLPAPPPTHSPEKERDDFLERKPAPFLRPEKQVGRNDPCPCGSGKKFKKCCVNWGKA